MESLHHTAILMKFEYFSKKQTMIKKIYQLNWKVCWQSPAMFCLFTHQTKTQICCRVKSSSRKDKYCDGKKMYKNFSWKLGFRGKCNNPAEFMSSLLQIRENLCWVEAHRVQKLVSEPYRVSHSEMNDSKWLWGVRGLIIFVNYGG